MNWINMFGLTIVTLMLVPNIIYDIEIKTLKINATIELSTFWSKLIDIARCS